ncbi:MULTISPECIES: hypothetical protein [Pseudoalteromonas]|jgi:hypothetical protein|uniref:Uncharacterized protein n=1 Tax=Pseudoalteromonas lipolytica TaxID=570156 RepID=A0ABY1GVY1_9GAMM|nr:MULTISPECIES: hypothetical protein [Pseudoalteromonas]MBE0349351.1 hypothetical protein [Pseudoalteromonas lipolytica LMEB 39]QMW14480.1 hypothetical protein H3302_15695 [Pseudoalteromonas sp. MT33b]QPL42853.1 hypothetical protein IT970_15635 [Pseudoalteromonas sp. A41-2]SFT90110.1 hypothetical protein SAMN04487854_11478 [Pseudoalteromonas lipolytica]
MAASSVVFANQNLPNSRHYELLVSDIAVQQSWQVKDIIKGYEMWEYQINLNKGNTLKVDFAPSNSSNYFNILPKGNPTALYVGPAKGDHAELKIPDDGNYVIWVFLMRNAAGRDEHSKFTEDISVIKSPLNGMHPSWDVDGDGPMIARKTAAVITPLTTVFLESRIRPLIRPH